MAPSERVQTTTACPLGGIATSGLPASPPGAESSTGLFEKPPPADAVAASTMWSAPSSRVQTAIASPAESTATDGEKASDPSAVSDTGAEKTPVSLREPAWITVLVPSKYSQTAVASPDASIATRGFPTSEPGADGTAEIASGALKVPPGDRTEASMAVDGSDPDSPSSCSQTKALPPAALTAR